MQKTKSSLWNSRFLIWSLPALGLLLTLAGLGFFGSSPRAALADTSTIYVRTDGSDANCDGTANSAYPGSGTGLTCAKQTIQAGTNAVSNSGTVEVGAGTFTGTVEITRPMTISGAGQLSTTVQPADNLAPTFTANSLYYYQIFYVHDTSNVNINQLTVDGAGKFALSHACADVVYGVYYLDADGGVTNTAIKGIRLADPNLGGCQSGVGFYAKDTTAAPRNVNFTGNTVSNYQKNATVFRGAGLTASINTNTITGDGPTTVIAQNGLQVSFGAAATILGNSVSGNYYSSTTMTDTDAAGILLYQTAGTIDVGNNTLVGNGSALLVDGVPAFTAHDNIITGQSVTGHNSYGVQVFDDGANTVGTLLSNTITGNNYGLYVADTSGDSTVPTITLSYNRLVSNTVGLDSSGDLFSGIVSATVDARNNWWGCNAGPNNPGCDTTNGPVQADPWLVLKLNGPASVAPNASVPITASIIYNSSQANSGGYVPNGTPVTFGISSPVTASVSPTSAVTISGIAVTTLSTGSATGSAVVSARVDSQTVTTTVNIVCNSGFVTRTDDANECGTLRYAVNNPPVSQTVTFAVAGPIQLDNKLTISGTLTIDGGSCAGGVPGVSLTKSALFPANTTGLEIRGGVYLKNLKISGFSGLPLKVDGGHNRLKCVVTKKAG